MQEAVALAHLSVATGNGDDDEEFGAPWHPVAEGLPRLLPVPSAWWETPAVTSRASAPGRKSQDRPALRPGAAYLLGAWALTDDAEMIIDELVVNAVLHGTGRARTPKPAPPLALAWRCCGSACSGGRRGHARGGRPRERDADAQAAGLGRESGRGLQIVGALSHVWDGAPSPARQGGMGRATRTLRRAAAPGHARPGRSAPVWPMTCYGRHSAGSDTGF